jgi:ribosome-associated heat shock protein Hsp15
VLSFAQGSRWVAVKVEALGERRGPVPEARALYSALTDAGATGADVAPKAAGRAVEGGDFNHTRG